MQGKPAMRGLMGKAAIVTGAGQGIGKAIADRLSDEGVKVLWADIDEQKVQESQKASGKGNFIKVTASFLSQTTACMYRKTIVAGSKIPGLPGSPSDVQGSCRWISQWKLRLSRWCR